MSREKEKTITELFNTYESTTVSEIPVSSAMAQMALLDILEEDEIIADWRLVTQDGLNPTDDDELVSLVVFGWGEPVEIDE